MVGLVLVVTPEFTENAVALLVARATVSNEDRGAMVGVRERRGCRRVLLRSNDEELFRRKFQVRGNLQVRTFTTYLYIQ